MRLIDTFPTNKIKEFEYRRGRMLPFGATLQQDGVPMMDPPLLDLIAHDAVLGKCMLIAEAWDADGMYQVGNFPSWGRWAEWNGKYRDCLRRFIKGGAECAPELFQRIRGSGDMYGDRGSEASVNFVTCHDGFTLYDLVSYNDKHNQANGEDNRDGCNDNNSWNCGAEGETKDKEINNLRFRQIKNMLTILLTSRGIPMLLSGDEFGNSQFGNNNAYCQDNEISWLDWKLLNQNKELFEYVKRLIEFRNNHPVLRARDYSFDNNETGYPELSFHGTQPWNVDEGAQALSFAYMYAEDSKKFGTKSDEFIYVIVNAFWEEQSFELPALPEKFKWYLAFEAYGFSSETGKEKRIDNINSITVGPRSTMILVGRK